MTPNKIIYGLNLLDLDFQLAIEEHLMIQKGDFLNAIKILYIVIKLAHQVEVISLQTLLTLYR